MVSEPIKILLVDDDEDYYVLTRDLLRDIEPGRYALDWIEHYDPGLAAMLTQAYDLCFLDYDLGERTGLELLQAAREAGCETPAIMLTGQGGYEVDLAAMHAGAADYVNKTGMNAISLERAVRYNVERAHTLRTLQERERHIAELYDKEQTHRFKLEDAYTELRRAEAQRDELVQMIVHDLRGPLTSVLGNLDLIDRAMRDADGKGALPHLLARTRINARRIVDMIDVLLTVSRLEAGALRPNLAPVGFAALLADKAPDFRLQAELANKIFVENVPKNLPVIQADAELLGRVLDNLVANALKYTPVGGRIGIAASVQAANLVVSVSDNGAGIAVEDQGRIFDKYYQVTAGDNPLAPKGAGIGLTFCRLAVEVSGGRIWVESDPDKGSVFSFSVPLLA